MMDKEKELIFKAMQYYLDSAQEFLSYDEMQALKEELENACRKYGIKPDDE